MGEEEVKRLLLVMADEKGEVSEQAFMKYMQEEFSKLNKDERGQVNDILHTDDLSMGQITTNGNFRYYMHDGATAFSFELAGRLSDDGARELQHTWPR